MSDLFHADVPTSFIQEVFSVMEDCSHLTFQVLTKRSDRLVELAHLLPWPRNIWMGVSVEDDQVLHRVHDLKKVPAAVRFLSCEPLIGSLAKLSIRGIDWVIAGGESGFNPRPLDPIWVVELRNKCHRAKVPFFFKQWGGRNKKAAGRELDGAVHDEMPQPKVRRRKKITLTS